VPNRAQFRSWTQLPGAAVKLQAAVCCGSERICSGESPAKLAGANLAHGKAMRASSTDHRPGSHAACAGEVLQVVQRRGSTLNGPVQVCKLLWPRQVQAVADMSIRSGTLRGCSPVKCSQALRRVHMVEPDLVPAAKFRVLIPATQVFWSFGNHGLSWPRLEFWYGLWSLPSESFSWVIIK
jgi:hypothetical protein